MLTQRIPKRSLKDTRLNGTDMRVLQAFCTYANRDGVCFPRRKVIVEDVEINIATFKRVVSKLIQFGYIERTARYRDHDSGQRSNSYRIIYREDNLNINKNEPGEAHKYLHVNVNEPEGGQKDYQININEPGGEAQNYYSVNQNEPGGAQLVRPHITNQVNNTKGSHSAVDKFYVDKSEKLKITLSVVLPLALAEFALQGVDQVRGRHIIGKMVKLHGSEPVANALQMMLHKQPVDAVAYLWGVLKGGPGITPWLSDARYRELVEKRKTKLLDETELQFVEVYVAQQLEKALQVKKQQGAKHPAKTKDNQSRNQSRYEFLLKLQQQGQRSLNEEERTFIVAFERSEALAKKPPEPPPKPFWWIDETAKKMSEAEHEAYLQQLRDEMGLDENWLPSKKVMEL